jgi:hypothetical protein
MTDQAFEKLFRESSDAEKLVFCRLCARAYEGEKIALHAQVLEKEIENGILYDVLKVFLKREEAAR